MPAAATPLGAANTALLFHVMYLYYTFQPRHAVGHEMPSGAHDDLSLLTAFDYVYFATLHEQIDEAILFQEIGSTGKTVRYATFTHYIAESFLH